MANMFLGLGYTIVLRAFLTFLMSFFICLVFGRRFINFLHSFQENGQPIRENGPKTHLQKKGTPTMGGLLILISIIISVLLFADLENVFVWVCLFVIFTYGLAGLVDDYEKISKNSSRAMSAKMKLVLQFCAALIAILLISQVTSPELRYRINFPFYIGLSLDLGLFYIPFAMIVIAGASNGVNLSDGLDGLSSGLLIMAFGAFAFFAYYIGIPSTTYSRPIAGAQEVTVICTAVVGACLGFLWYNAPKAEVFMGDTGSLPLGALLGTVSVILKQEFLLGVVGIVFVIETISVFLQIFWYKTTGRRIFRMAPLHHHFEQLGWPETRVTVRFWIIGFIGAIVSLGSLFRVIGLFHS